MLAQTSVAGTEAGRRQRSAFAQVGFKFRERRSSRLNLSVLQQSWDRHYRSEKRKSLSLFFFFRAKRISISFSSLFFLCCRNKIGRDVLTISKYPQTIAMQGVTAVNHRGVQVTGHLGQLLSGAKFTALFRSWSASEELQTPYAQRTVETVA